MTDKSSDIDNQAAIDRDRARPSARYASAWLAGDRAALVASYHDDFTLHYFGRNPLAGIHRGKAGFARRSWPRSPAAPIESYSASSTSWPGPNAVRSWCARF